jgi:hypothetical protein
MHSVYSDLRHRVREGDVEMKGDDGDDRFRQGTIPHLAHPLHLLYPRIPFLLYEGAGAFEASRALFEA